MGGQFKSLNPADYAGSSPGQTLQEKGKAADIVQSGASAASAAASANKTNALLPYEVRKKAREEQAAEEAAAAEEEAKKRGKSKTLGDTENLLFNIQQARDNIGFLSTGPVGQATRGLWATPANDLKSTLKSIASPVVLKAMAEARAGSKVGATGFGALSEKELGILASAIANIEQSQTPEQLRTNLDRVERSYRRFMAYNTGMDPDSPEGAHWAGLAAPSDADVGGGGGEVTGEGKTVLDPTLRGVDSTVVAMIKEGRTADQIRAWLNEVKPGLGDRAKNLEANVTAWKESKGRPVGWDVTSTIEGEFKPNEGAGAIIGKMMDTSAGAAALGYGDAMSLGTLDEMSGDQARAAALMRGVSDKHGTAYGLGQLGGAVGQAMTGEGLLAKYGIKAPGLFMDVAQSGAYGAGSAAPGSRLEGAATGAILGGALGTATRVGGNALGTVARGVQDPAAALLAKYDIPMTVGQIVRGGVKRTEDKLTSMPILGGQILGRRQDALRKFNEVAFDEALQPLGVSTAGEIGQAGVAKAQDAVNTAYRDALGGLTLNPDITFVQTVRGPAYHSLSKLPEVGPGIVADIDKAIMDNLTPTGQLTGEGFQTVRQLIGDLKREYSDVRGFRTKIKPYFNTIEEGLDDLVKRQAPERFDDYMNANEAFKRVKVLQDAVEVTPAEAGELLTPAILRRKTREHTIKFGGRAASARGDRPFNDLTKAGGAIMAPGYPDAGTAGRVLLPLGIASALGGGNYASTKEGEEDRGTNSALLGLAGAALASAPYSRGGQKLVQNMVLGERPQVIKWLGDALVKYAPTMAGVARMNATNEHVNRTPAPKVPIRVDPAIVRAQAAPAAPAPSGAALPRTNVITLPDGTQIDLDDPESLRAIGIE